MALEVEARFRATGPEPLADLATAASLGTASLGPATTFDEVDRYLDTESGSLAAARWACRLRSRGSRVIISLKGPPSGGSGGWLHRRPEVEGPADDGLDPNGWPQSDARDRLRELSHGAELHEHFRLLQQRTERTVSIRGRRVGTLSLDEVRGEREGHQTAAFHVVELELFDEGAANRAALEELAAALGETPGLVAEPSTKLEYALALIGR